MIEIKTKRYGVFVLHYAEDENGIRYKIRQNETNEVLTDARDLVPCRHTYTALTEKIEEIGENA